MNIKSRKGLSVIWIVVAAVIIIAVAIALFFAFGTKYNTVSYNNANFKISTNYNYTVESDGIKISDKNDKWEGYIKLIQADYQTLVSKQDVLKSSIEQQGLTISNIGEKTISGRNFIILETLSSDYKLLVGYSKYSSTEVYVISVQGIDNNFDYNLIENLVPILDSAVK